MKEIMLTMIEHYGYGAIFVSMMLGIIGLPLPIEFLLLFIGSLTGAAHLNVYWIIAYAWLGTTVGMSVSYYLGKTIGIHRISKLTKWIHLPEEKLMKWANRFQKIGPLLLLFGFFIAGLRHASPFIAGASSMPFKKFIWIAIGGGLSWIGLITFAGQRLGGHWHMIGKLLHNPWFILSLILVILGMVILKKFGGRLHPWMDELLS